MANRLKPRLSKIGLGCVTFGREIDQAASFAMMDHAVANGITFFDSASAYGAGASEKAVGAWLAARRPAAGSVVIATKIVPPYVAGELEARLNQSLERLQQKQIDLFYLHAWAANAVDPEILGTLDRFVRQGKVKSLGASNHTAEQLGSILKVQAERGYARMEAVQNNHNYAVRGVDEAMARLCAAEDVAVVTYSPLGAGFLTGKHRQGVPPGTRFEIIPGHDKIYFNDSGWKRLDELEAAAARSGRSQVELAFAWALRQPMTSSVLVGGRTPAHLDQAIAALRVSPADINRALPPS